MITPELEEKLVQACAEGDVELCRSSVVELQTRSKLSSEPVQELLGYAFSCAAAHNQIEIMELLLYPAPSTISASSSTVALSKDIHECLLYAVVCVEQNALQALEFLTKQQVQPIPELLVDTDVMRCFRCALEFGSDFHAQAPEAYRPMLMMLLYRYPMLLLPHVDGKHDHDPGASVSRNTRNHMESLRASLMYEYVTNPQLQIPTE
ncbi:hypothetical protein PF005_g4817 [Phytophthora fragariae]|uniref:Uncharacterized protein n=1 Tax=Phytophthora fragariae TaxID=53985 RepID=A0A6A3ZP65_9STRA|nr:hypothetical protein PF003_g19234 [Phytophthora fragariae]KAE8945120.1 hypothetical protein PF009_g5218 [Phytophthora fragariae]KAE9019718.1 hypothetical protein PF011_g5718 [Phytophthora fragariae]KAE9127055.1 hypothetical protein PF007_g5750 [Phytophthora fragariae]KAE9136798.1 hypothetical protein PF010_g1554 [Phytophthora fragariae]